MFHMLIITFILLLSGCGYKGDPKYVSLSSDTVNFSQKTAKQDLSNKLMSQKSIKREIS
ncbi:MAG: lipoprotein [Campylobacteraceae bacterium]|nr:lipoprotein [Campylobacteraceae bacterium]